MERARWTNFPDLFRRAADYGDKSLRGAKLGNPLAEQRALGLRWRAMSKAAMASMSKFLAQTNKSADVVRATKRYRPEGDVGEAKNQHTSLPTAE
jgi:hypothetical protein